MDLRLLVPGFLFLLAAVPVLWLWPRRMRDVVHGVLRTLVLVFLVLALARPVAFTDGGPAHHVVVLDASASAGSSRKALVERARAFARAADGDLRSTLVVVGERSGIDGYHRVIPLAGPHGTSPLGAALETAARAVPHGARGAVTLLSDGQATARRWGAATQTFGARGIPVHVVVAPAANDVRPVRLEVVGEPRVGHTARLRAHVVGEATAADVRLLGPSGVLASVDAVPVEGRALVTLEFEPAKAGFLRLAVETVVRDGRDEDRTNDRLETTIAVQDPMRVLYLGQRVRGGAARLGELVGAGFEVVEAEGVAALDVVDLVVLDDRPADAVPEGVQRALVDGIADRGLGLLFAGGRAAFGPGGWKDTTLASRLPVDLVQREEKRDPSTTLVVIIDTSGSMGGNRVQLAKEVARLSIRRLLPHDKVGIVEFYGAKRWAAPIQPASNAIEIQRALNRLNAGGGTVILPAIEEAFYALQNVRTRYKHVLVLTDGGVERGAFETLLRKMAEEGITVSSVLIGPETHSEFLVNLSNWGKGRFYSVPNRFNLPEVLLKQPASARLPAYRPGSFPLRTRGGTGWWGRVDVTSVPPLGGYVETRARPGATTLLEVESGKHPVLCTWRYGLGRVTALMTEPTGPGTAPWADWDGYGPFLARILTRTATSAALPVRFEIARRGDEVVVTARRVGFETATPTAVLLGSGGEGDTPLVFRVTAPGRLEATLVLAPEREARVLAGVRDDPAERTVRLVSPALEDVAAEGQVDPREALDLEALAAATGGTVARLHDPAAGAPALGGGEAPVAIRPLAPWCLLIALVAYLAEIAWRRRPRRRGRIPA